MAQTRLIKKPGNFKRNFGKPQNKGKLEETKKAMKSIKPVEAAKPVIQKPSIAPSKVASSLAVDLSVLVGMSWWKIPSASGPTAPDSSKSTAASIYYSTLSSYDSLMREDKEQKFLRQLVGGGSKGTLSDRVSALVSLCEQSGLFSLPYLKQLVLMLQKKNVKESLLALEGLKKLFTGGSLIPSHRKLVFFSESASSIELMVSFFEDALKTAFAAFVQVSLDLFNKQSLPVVQTKVLETAFEVIRSKPEQEKALLSLMVSGLGSKVDQKSIPAKTNLLLRKLCIEHDRMKEAVVTEVRNQHFQVGRDGVPAFLQSVYYPTVFLYGLPLNPKNDGDVAASIVLALIHVVVIAGGAEETDKKVEHSEFSARLVRLALEGLQKAFAVAADSSVISSPVSESTTQSLLRLSYSTPMPGLAVAVLAFLYKASSSFGAVPVPFLKAVYHQCSSFEVLRSTAGDSFLRLVTEVVEKDIKEDSHKIAFLRRLLQTALVSGDVAGKHIPTISDMLNQLGFRVDLSDDSTGSYKPDDRDYAFAGASTEFIWEHALLSHHADESARPVASGKKRKHTDGLSATDLLQQFIQPEQSSWTFARKHTELSTGLPKRSSKKATILDDEEVDAALAEMDNEAVGDEEGDEVDDIDLSGDEMDDFGESIDGSDMDDDEIDDEDGDEIGDEEEEDGEEEEDDDEVSQQEIERSAKMRKMLKKFSGSTFVDADELNEYLD